MTGLLTIILLFVILGLSGALKALACFAVAWLVYIPFKLGWRGVERQRERNRIAALSDNEGA